MSNRRSALAAVLTLLTAVWLAHSQSRVPAVTDAQGVVTGVAVRALSPVHPVLGIDDRFHLAWELEVVNHTADLITVDRVEALDDTGRKLAELQGDALARRVQISGRETGTTFGPSHSGYIFLDVSVPKSSPLPRTIRHRIATTTQRRAAPGDDHHASTDPAARLKEPTLTFIGAAVSVDPTPAVAIAAPLRGSDWLVANGCCDESLNGHRIVTFAFNGAITAPEKFAIDILQLDRDHRLYTGPADKLSSYAYYGVPVYAVADGTVVYIEDGAPDQTPGTLPAGMTPATAGGNNVVMDIGTGHFAYYAHLQPGSIRVRAGDRVHRGDILGRLGNTGNTTNPHLHFHITDGPSPLGSNSLPYVFTNLKVTGTVIAVEPVVLEGKPATINPAMAGPHPNRLPPNMALVSFE